MSDVTSPDWHSYFFQDILELADMAVLVINQDFKVVYANTYVCERIIGMPQSDAIGMSLPEHTTVPDEDLQRVIDHTKRVLQLGVAECIENWALHRDGSRRLMYWSTVPKLDADGKVEYLMAAGMDVTEQRREKNILEDMAHHDALTELHNRAFFERRLPENMSRAAQEGNRLALLYIDLDGFKPVNDHYGHEMGDTVLREVAVRLRKGLRQSDTVCRIGGDEFAVILPGMASRNDVSNIANQMIFRLSQPYEIGGHVLQLGASIGVAFSGGGMQDAHELVRKADEAMYMAKQSGKCKFVIAT